MDDSNHFFHARGDHPEVRAAFFRFLIERNDFMCYFSVVEKDAEIFIHSFQKLSEPFYFHVVENLLQMPLFRIEDNHAFYLSKRNKNTHTDFDRVIRSALNTEMSDGNFTYSADVVKSAEYPELSVIDYVLWAIQRCKLKGESRFANALEDKIKGIVCGYGTLQNCKYPIMNTTEFIEFVK